jgi:site-specific DNA recombinase
MLVALYPRVSTQEQAKEGYSIGEQIDRLNKYCEAMGWTVYKTYTDPGYSGGDMNRPGLQEMIKDVKAGKVDKVVVYKLDRLSRSQKDTLILIEDVFLANKVDFVSVSESFDTSSPVGRAVLGLLAVFAQLEREQIKERMGMGKEARAKEGKWGGGSSVPIGYDYNPDTEELEVNVYEAMQIKEAIELFLKGTPLRTMSTIFHNKGYTYRGRSGKISEWEPKRFKYVFKSKVYLGYISYRGEWYKGNHTPIIDEETHDKLIKLLNERADMYAKHKKKCRTYSSYLGGFLYCKQCGAKFTKTSWSTRKKDIRKHFYTCYSRSKKVAKMIKDPNCLNKNWRMEELDNLIFNEIKKLALDPEYIHEIRDNKRKESDNPNKIEIINREISIIDSQISRFMDLYGVGAFTIDQVSEKVEPLNNKKNNLLKELESLNADLGDLSVVQAIEIIKSFDEVFNRGDLDEIRLVIEQLIYYIEIDEDDVYIHWKFAQ